MFVDFDKALNHHPETQLVIPEALVSYLNEQLPKGTKYIVDKNGNCVLRQDGESLTIGGFTFAPTEEQRNVLGKKFTMQDVLDYSYNSQEKIPLSLTEEGFILLNGEKFPIDRLNYNPHNPIKYISNSAAIFPQPFPAEFNITLSDGKYSRNIIVRQITNKSVHVSAFESRKAEPICIRYFVDTKKHTISINLAMNLNYATCIRDLVESIAIYNAFISGKGLLCGTHICAPLTGENAKQLDEHSLPFWEKVLEIEQHLGVSFTPPTENVDFDTVCLVEQLYQNLICHAPIRDINKIDTLSADWNMNGQHKPEDSIGQVLYFEFDATMNIDLFGVKKTLPCMIKIFNAKLADVSKKSKKLKMTLVDESVEKPCYTSLMCFTDEDAMQKYKTHDRNEVIQQFHDAKFARDYYSE